MGGALAVMRLVGSGNPPLHRFRVGVEFAVSGHRDLDGMIAQHSALARRLAEQLGLSEAVQEAVGASYEQWDGKGWPGRAAGRCHPGGVKAGPDRRVHRGGAPHRRHRARRWRWPRSGPGRQFDPNLAAAFCAHAEPILDGLDAGETWEAVIGAEPALGVYSVR